MNIGDMTHGAKYNPIAIGKIDFNSPDLKGFDLDNTIQIKKYGDNTVDLTISRVGMGDLHRTVKADIRGADEFATLFNQIKKVKDDLPPDIRMREDIDQIIANNIDAGINQAVWGQIQSSASAKINSKFKNSIYAVQGNLPGKKPDFSVKFDDKSGKLITRLETAFLFQDLKIQPPQSFIIAKATREVRYDVKTGEAFQYIEFDWFKNKKALQEGLDIPKEDLDTFTKFTSSIGIYKLTSFEPKEYFNVRETDLSSPLVIIDPATMKPTKLNIRISGEGPKLLAGKAEGLGITEPEK